MSRSYTTRLTLATALALLAGCGRSETPAHSAAPAPAKATKRSDVVTIPADSPQAKQIRVEPVRAADIPADEVVAPARVSIDPQRISRVLPFVQGRVVTVLAKLGDTVRQGQPLVTLDSPDADAAISAHLQAEATGRQTKVTLTKAQADLDRTRELFQHQAVAAKDVLTAQNDFATAQAAAENIHATLDQTTRKLELLGLKPNDFRRPVVVRAPIAGVITDISVTQGEYRAALSYASDTTAPLMTIADLSTVWISSDVPESSIRLIHVGDRVTVTLIAYPGEEFTGRVTRIADLLDPQTRTVKVYIEMPNPKGRLRPEMFGNIRHWGAVHAVPVLPISAVIQEYGKSVVFLERAPGQFERREVTIGVRSGDVVPVLSGVQVGDRVIVDGAVLLKGQ